MFGWLSRTFFHHQSLGGYLEPIMQKLKPAWREGYFRAKIYAVQQQMNTLVIDLKPEKAWPTHQAGQHIELTVEIAGRLMTRMFTIASSPIQRHQQQLIRLIVKPTAQGKMTAHLAETLNVGRWLNISAPRGSFTLEPVIKHQQQNILMVAAGSGITPFLAMLSELSLSAMKGRFTQQIQLVYYAKPNEHLMVTMLQKIADKWSDFSFQLMTRVDNGEVAEQLKHLKQFSSDKIMVCGPQAFYQSVKAFAERQGVPLISEHFSPLKVIHTTNNTQQAPSPSTVQVQFAEQRLQLTDQSSLLEQLELQGIAVDFGCRVGNCHQCRCTKVRGIVRDLRSGTLSDAGEELIQLCVSQAVTDLELKP